jgi:hypothetical protein
MQIPKISAVISFCSNDWRFLKHCIHGISSFCEEVILTVCDHFFDGSKENYGLLEEAFRCFPDCTFIEFNFDSRQSYRAFSPLYPEHPYWRHEWHNTGRWLSYFYSSSDTQLLFFLDCDEIVNTEQFKNWLATADFIEHSAYRFAGFWHFREAQFEASAHNDLSLLVKKGAMDPHFLWDEEERMGLFHRLPEKKQLGVRSCNDVPMIRHYSGVRTEEEFSKKLSCWGHHWERDWSQLLQEEFSRPFNGRDFIRRYEYHQIQPHFDPLKEQVPQLFELSYEEHVKNLHRFPNVVMVSRKEAFKRQFQDEFQL